MGGLNHRQHTTRVVHSVAFLLVRLVQAVQDQRGRPGWKNHNGSTKCARDGLQAGALDQLRSGSKGAIGDQRIIGNEPLLAFEKANFCCCMIEYC
jgi:hypothetical protein